MRVSARILATSRRRSARSEASSAPNGSSSNIGTDGERAGQRHPLLLAAGELVRIALVEPGQADQLEQFVDRRPLRSGEPEGDVAAHGQVREQGALLRDVADAAVLRGDRAPAVIDHLLADPQAAAVEPLEPGDQPQQRGLAAARGAEDGGDGPLWDGQLDAGEDHCLAESLGR